ncbi:hypothetical protein B4N89_45985 [Embleya scabrispora]|uniref:DUF397 domain-containing protein n=1 Tax=Embleya scabrispora TaxID=159449 RepID=A0A1T3NJ10_9ACTN|nr:DUF397 domain-containing protein [Embleya scabrispora]OPC76827.1 hypothetical protein B4N89_45985 [Embleya scabrispora]
MPFNAATIATAPPLVDAAHQSLAGEHRSRRRAAGDRASKTPQPEEPLSNHPRRKSSYSADVNCVEAGLGTGNDVEVADTKLPPSITLTFPNDSWTTFLNDTSRRD